MIKINIDKSIHLRNEYEFFFLLIRSYPEHGIEILYNLFSDLSQL
jgi:hypothetical protein